MGLNGVVTRYRDESNSKERPLQPDGNFAMNTLDVELNLLRRFRACAEKALPGRITRLVLFGSRARREAHARSDWDVAVFLKNGASNKDS